jgi:hypothetical protein
MGSSHYSDDFYNDRVADRIKTGTPTFAYDTAVKTGAVKAGVHDSLNIKGKIREARDSKEHPNSTPIAIIFDQTGSMAGVPIVMQTKLPQLMGLLLRKAYIEDPQILFGAIGDWRNHEAAPLQIGQFESGIEMDDNITHIYLEGSGGGSSQESYQNALYYFAHRTSCDAFEKRGKKGYLFLIGDEMAYNEATKRELSDLIGVEVQEDVSMDAIMEAVKEKWEVFFIIPKGTSHWDDKRIETFWKKYLGQNFIQLEDPAAVCEVIGATIGLCEGTTDSDSITTDLKDVGTRDSIVHVASAAVDAIAKDRALAKVGTGTLPAKKGRSEKNERL